MIARPHTVRAEPAEALYFFEERQPVGRQAQSERFSHNGNAPSKKPAIPWNSGLSW